MIMKTYDELTEEELKLVGDEFQISTEELTRRKIKKWLKEHSYLAFRNEIRKSVIGQTALDDVMICIYLYLEKIANGLSKAETILLTSPSGCGKTETYRAVREYLRKELPFLPCYLFDVSSLAETSYRGAHIAQLMEGLFEGKETNGIGIVWLDEFDKKVIPSFESGGSNSNAAVQREMLTVLEGRDVNKYSRSEEILATVNTNNTLFIALGSFDHVREERTEESKEMGFGASGEAVEHYDSITRQDLIDGGGIYELIGRITTIFNYVPLDEKSVRKIIELIRNDEENEFNIFVELKESTVKKLLESANTKYGCRLIRSTMHERLLSQYKVILEKRLNRNNVQIVLDEAGDRVEKIA